MAQLPSCAISRALRRVLCLALLSSSRSARHVAPASTPSPCRPGRYRRRRPDAAAQFRYAWWEMGRSLQGSRPVESIQPPSPALCRGLSPPEKVCFRHGGGGRKGTRQDRSAPIRRRPWTCRSYADRRPRRAAPGYRAARAPRRCARRGQLRPRRHPSSRRSRATWRARRAGRG